MWQSEGMRGGLAGGMAGGKHRGRGSRGNTTIPSCWEHGGVNRCKKFTINALSLVNNLFFAGRHN